MKTEWWQRGPVDAVPAMLQPVAHIVLQIGESVPQLVDGLNEAEWNARPGGIASCAFHVRHIIGVLDRLFTYARGEALSAMQFVSLRGEGQPITLSYAPELLMQLEVQVAISMAQLRDRKSVV